MWLPPLSVYEKPTWNCYTWVGFIFALSLRLGDSHPIPRCSNKDNILCY